MIATPIRPGRAYRVRWHLGEMTILVPYLPAQKPGAD